MYALHPVFSNKQAASEPAGDSVTFIRRNHYILFNGEEKLVEDFRPNPPFYSTICEKTYYSDYPPERPDDIKVQIDGQWHDYDAETMRALPVPDDMKPAKLQEGAKIRIHGCDDYVRGIYLLKTPEDQTGRVTFDCDVMVNCSYDPKKILVHSASRNFNI